MTEAQQNAAIQKCLEKNREEYAVKNNNRGTFLYGYRNMDSHAVSNCKFTDDMWAVFEATNKAMAEAHRLYSDKDAPINGPFFEAIKTFWKDVSAEQKKPKTEAVHRKIIGGLIVLEMMQKYISVMECNRPITVTERAVSQFLDELFVTTVEKSLGSGYEAVTDGDPRGTIYSIKLPSGRYNTMGGPDKGLALPSPQVA